ncbi:MAG: polysaccharide biosynthesis tyrosine autokinase [Leptolyngbyaceae cyanobacterium bins.59]|nr:polysaccharide biosynthesis tyrosine autokinase [Leptolyngbyaceae cyanobacterium bins.59]
MMARSFSSIPSIFLRHWLPACSTLAMVMMAAVAYLQSTPRLYETSTRLILDEKRVSVSELGRDLARLSDIVPGGPNPIATQAELVKSQRVLNRALKHLANRKSATLPTMNQLNRGLKIKIIPATNILELSYRGPDPKMAADILNAVATSMVEENVESIRAGAQSVKTFLQAEVPRQRAILQRAEEVENLYRQENQLVSVPEQTRKLVETLGTFENQERDLSAQLQEVSSRNLSLKQVIGAGPLSSAYTSVRVGQDEELKNLRAKLLDLETRVINEQSRLGDQHPDLLALIEQRDEVRNLYGQRLSRLVPGANLNQSDPANEQSNTDVQSNIATDALSQDLTSRLIISEVERVALAQKLQVVRQERSALQARLAELPIKQQPLTNLTRAREEAEATLKQLQAKLQEATIAEAQLVSNLQVISPAELPLKPQWPKKLVVLVTATFFGAVLVVALVVALELLDDSLHEIREAEDILKQPSLGNLPLLPARLKNLSQPASFLDSSHLVEPYRKLLKTLEHQSGKQLRLLVVSSARTGEGKSTVAAHLATVSAMLSQRTLLIDANLHQPRQHEIFQLPMEPGLTNVVQGELVLQEAIQSTNIENLAFLSSGTPTQRPSVILETAGMKSLLEKAAYLFDLVIIDTPPIDISADAIVLGRYSDGMLMVVRPGISSRSRLTQAMQELTKNEVSLVGFVANGTRHALPLSNSKSSQSYKSNSRSKLLQRLPFSHRFQEQTAIGLGRTS